MADGLGGLLVFSASDPPAVEAAHPLATTAMDATMSTAQKWSRAREADLIRAMASSLG